MIFKAWRIRELKAMKKQVQAGGSEVQGYPWQHSQAEASLGYMKPCLKIIVLY